MAEDNKRANRGKRIHELDEDGKKEDEDFWAKNPYFHEGTSSENGTTKRKNRIIYMISLYFRAKFLKRRIR